MIELLYNEYIIGVLLVYIYFDQSSYIGYLSSNSNTSYD